MSAIQDKKGPLNFEFATMEALPVSVPSKQREVSSRIKRDSVTSVLSVLRQPALLRVGRSVLRLGTAIVSSAAETYRRSGSFSALPEERTHGECSLR